MNSTALADDIAALEACLNAPSEPATRHWPSPGRAAHRRVCLGHPSCPRAFRAWPAGGEPPVLSRRRRRALRRAPARRTGPRRGHRSVPAHQRAAAVRRVRAAHLRHRRGPHAHLHRNGLARAAALRIDEARAWVYYGMASTRPVSTARRTSAGARARRAGGHRRDKASRQHLALRCPLASASARPRGSGCRSCRQALACALAAPIRSATRWPPRRCATGPPSTSSRGACARPWRTSTARPPIPTSACAAMADRGAAGDGPRYASATSPAPAPRSRSCSSPTGRPRSPT